MNTKNFFLAPLIASLLFCSIHNNSYASEDNSKAAKNEISSYIISESYSNILPVKLLLKDDWKQAPAEDASIGFTQNEIGVKAYWQNFTFGIAHRLDYFVYTNSDTAEAFYLERTDQPLTTQDSYKLSLKLHHQRSNGFRFGYKWQYESFSTEVNIGYWDVTATRESHINGEVFGEENNNITGTAQLSEFYSDKNFLKRDKFDRWDIDGYGVTVDVSALWQINNKLNLALHIKDLYSKYRMKNLGYSEGNVDTEGTFINSLGGQSYLPLYRGKETSDNYQFELPEHINLIAHYQEDSFSSETLDINYVARYKRQGTVNFYYAGVQLDFDTATLSLMLDLENLSPQVQYNNQWFNIIFAIDELDIEKAKQFTLGMAVNYSFN